MSVRDNDGIGWFTWGHLGVTIALVGFVWSVWYAGQNERVSLEGRLAALEEQNRGQDRMTAANVVMIESQLAEITRRMDVQRDDLRRLQEELLTHDRKGVR